MRSSTAAPNLLLPWLLLLQACICAQGPRHDVVSDPFVAAQEELTKVVQSIAEDIMAGNIDGLQALHLNTVKFSKFGPRHFERQDLAATNASEAEYFGSLSGAIYEVTDLKIDVFGDVGIATYYPRVSLDGGVTSSSGRQTLVLLKTREGWKIVHEHGTPRPSGR